MNIRQNQKGSKQKIQNSGNVTSSVSNAPSPKVEQNHKKLKFQLNVKANIRILQWIP